MVVPFSDVYEWNYYEGAAWNRFFVSPAKAAPGRSWHDTPNQNAFMSIKSNLVQLNRFPVDGKINRNGQYTQARRITYTCKEPTQFARKYGGIGRCAGIRGLGAYRVEPAAFGPGWGIVFCPLFFNNHTYLNRITDGPRKQLEDLRKLISYEHLLSHEILHCNIIGTVKPIEDMVGNIPGQRDGLDIYGHTRCHEWAWAYNRGPRPGAINVMTAVNADNYAWFLTNRWFDKHWGWNDYVDGIWFGDPRDGAWLFERKAVSHPNERIQDFGTNPTYPDDPDTFPHEHAFSDIDYDGVDTIDVGPVPNCRQTGDDPDNDVYCDYVGELYSDYLKDVHDDFLSVGGCLLTKECHASEGMGIVASRCACYCDGTMTDLADPRCAGYEGRQLESHSPVIDDPSIDTPLNMDLANGWDIEYYGHLLSNIYMYIYKYKRIVPEAGRYQWKNITPGSDQS